jgi:adenine phosphoribosyltransferase
VTGSVTQRLRESIRDIPDFPRPGIVFKDITTLLADADRFREALDLFEERWKDEGVEVVVGVESRGFIFGGALADRLGAAFVPMRKRGRLPGDTVVESYDLEYGTDSLELHSDAFTEGTRVLIVDDLLATGGTAEAAAKLVERLGGEVAGLAFVVNLAFLPGASKLRGYPTQVLVEFDRE